MSNTEKSPDQSWLEFVNSESVKGFVSKSVAADNEANPTVITRELIQNSLDAMLELEDRKTARVSFIFDDIPLNQIPGIEQYQQAFQVAKGEHESHGGAPEEAQIKRISRSLQCSHIPVLLVQDNGIGLNSDRMHSLLSDGATDKGGKESKSAGSYGVGHFTAFAASDMHYILYGGVTPDGVKTMSAQAILASHAINGVSKGENGYYITGRTKERKERRLPYHFPLDEQIPPYVKKLLDDIQSNDGSGSVVSFVAFNNFHEDEPKKAARSIIRGAAQHFFPAIHQGRLEIQVKYNDGQYLLNRTTLQSILTEMRGERRVRKKDYKINGGKAYAAYQTLVNDRFKSIDTGFGTVGLYFRPAASDEHTHISLFRSGMYISDNLPKNSPTTVYPLYEPFNAVLLVDPPDDPKASNEAFSLIQGAEGEKHVSIDKNQLDELDPDKFDQLFEDIQSAIKSLATEDKGDSFSAEFMMLEWSSESTLQSRRPSKPTNTPPRGASHYTQVSEYVQDLSVPDGMPDRSEPGTDPKPSGPQPNPVAPVSSFQRSGRRAQLQVAARRRQGELSLSLLPRENVENAGLRLVLFQGSDPSCSDPLPNQFIKLQPEAVLDGEKVSNVDGIKENKPVYEIALGALEAGKRYQVRLNLEENISADATIGVDLVSRQKKR